VYRPLTEFTILSATERERERERENRSEREGRNEKEEELSKRGRKTEI